MSIIAEVNEICQGTIPMGFENSSCPFSLSRSLRDFKMEEQTEIDPEKLKTKYFSSTQ